MSLPVVVVISARGRESFTADQIALMELAADVRFVKAETAIDSTQMRALLDGAVVAALTPRAARGFGADVFGGLTALRAICIPTTGLEWLDVAGLAERGIVVSNVPDFSSASCAEFALGLVIALARRVCDMRIQPGQPLPSVRPGIELAGKTLGVVGMGNVGRRVASLGSALGMNVLACDPSPGPTTVKLVSIKQLLTISNVISLHVPLNPQTRGMFNCLLLSEIREGALVINTAGPGVVDTEAMVEAIVSGWVGGYAFDTGYASAGDFAHLIALPQVVAVPHVSWYTREAVERERAAWVDNIVAAAQGNPANTVCS